MPKNTDKTANINELSKDDIDNKYNELKAKFRALGAEEDKMQLFDDLFISAAVIACDLERIKYIPTIIINAKYPSITKQSDAGKARVKLVAQLRDTLSKLYRDIVGTIPEDFDEDLEDFQ